MKIVTWNVNSIRARLDIVKNWVHENQPDVLLLQELKCQEDDFPKIPFYDLGYNIAIHGQKSYNGVAILAKSPIEDVQKNLPTFMDDQARYIEAIVGDVRVASLYLPNGQSISSDKYAYKLKFCDGLFQHLQNVLGYEEKFVVGGDFNIVPTMNDVKDPEFTDTSILCSYEERQAYRKILNLGFASAIDVCHPVDPPMTWWDYRGASFQKDYGLRIDHLLLSPEATDKLSSAHVDGAPRQLEKASDHAPVICALNH